MTQSRRTNIQRFSRLASALLITASLVVTAQSQAATINYLTGSGGFRANVTLSSPFYGSQTAIDQRRGSSLLPGGGTDSMFINHEDPGTPIAFDGVIDMNYAATLTPSQFSLNVSVPAFDMPSDTIDSSVSTSVSISFTVDETVDAILVGANNTGAGETIAFTDAGLTEYFWTETLNGPPLGTFPITLTAGTVYHASLWTGFGQETASLTLVLVPEPGTALLLAAGLVFLARPPRKA